ncbi:VanZ family protein [Ornithinicoccus hortensis]|uniref:VanZ family protein n=1 Tax=Ornithinicoccus hortensis TaxID=82346 RepID=UPI001153A6F6
MVVNRKWPWSCLVAYVIFLGAVGLWVSAVDAPVSGTLSRLLVWGEGHGFGFVRYAHVEAAANLLLFVPLGFLIVLVARPRSWPWAALAGFLVSLSIELAQLGLSARTTQLRDVVFNTAGALVGALAASAWVHQSRSAHQRATRPAKRSLILTGRHSVQGRSTE